MKIGICGMGRMGAAMAHRLLSVGHEVTVWNRDPKKAEPLVEAGAKKADTPAALASANEVVITMLLNAAALDAVYNGPAGLLSGGIAGKLAIDMSTVLPETSEAIGKAVAAKGASFVECPVGGTVGPARNGQLLGLVGGAEGDVARAKPILEQLCRRIEHVGPVGAGAKIKLAVNLPLLVYWQALGEALTLTAPLGLPPERLLDILADTTGAPAAIKMRGPEVAKVLGGQATGAPAFEVLAARKDLATMVTFADTLGAKLPVTASALACYDKAIEAGLGNADPINVPVFWATKGAKA
jgi:3-hydroxyisobutyrate dehydrogenase